MKVKTNRRDAISSVIDKLYARRDYGWAALIKSRLPRLTSPDEARRKSVIKEFWACLKKEEEDAQHSGPWDSTGYSLPRRFLEKLGRAILKPRHCRYAGACDLLTAARMGDLRSLRGQLAQGVPQHVRDANGNTPLHLAAGSRDGSRALRVVRALVKAGADVNAVAYDGTPLASACAAGNAAVARFLLSRGAHANPHGAEQDAPLMHACGRADAALVKLLLKHGANPNIVGDNYKTPLMRAVEAAGSADARIVKRLISAEADLELKDHSGRTALEIALRRRWKGVPPTRVRGVPAVAALLKACPGLEERVRARALRRERRERRLWDALAQGDVPGVASALGAGADVHRSNSRGETPLMKAVAIGLPGAVRLILDANAAPVLYSPYRITAADISVRPSDYYKGAGTPQRRQVIAILKRYGVRLSKGSWHFF